MIDTTQLERCCQTLEKAFLYLKEKDKSELDYDIYRSACIKEFEIILEMSGKMLRKLLKPHFHTSRAVDELAWKDVFRNCVLKGFFSAEFAERWFDYRDYRNATAHDYGANLAEETLESIPSFVLDTQTNISIIKNQSNLNDSAEGKRPDTSGKDIF